LPSAAPESKELLICGPLWMPEGGTRTPDTRIMMAPKRSFLGMVEQCYVGLNRAGWGQICRVGTPFETRFAFGWDAGTFASRVRSRREVNGNRCGPDSC
jgi:hypothetical protein